MFLSQPFSTTPFSATAGGEGSIPVAGVSASSGLGIIQVKTDSSTLISTPLLTSNVGSFSITGNSILQLTSPSLGLLLGQVQGRAATFNSITGFSVTVSTSNVSVTGGSTEILDGLAITASTSVPSIVGDFYGYVVGVSGVTSLDTVTISDSSANTIDSASLIGYIGNPTISSTNITFNPALYSKSRTIYLNGFGNSNTIYVKE